MYIQSLSIDNLRCFRAVEINFQYPERDTEPSVLKNVNLVLGNNGSGKTTVLKAVALATLSLVLESAGFVPYRLVRRTRTERASYTHIRADILLHAQDVGSKDKTFSSPYNIQVRIDRIRDVEKITAPPNLEDYWENIYDNGSPAFLVMGYGANRRVESSSTFDEGARQKSRQLRYQRVAGLFEEQVTLMPLEAWLPRIKTENPRRYKEIVNLINRLLPAECRFTEETEDGIALFEHRGVRVPIGALSDGYRAYIGWITDLLYHLWSSASNGTKLIDNKGIVLVDEIDLHLHPEWQRTVIPNLSAALPNLQFVLTSHSPIVAGTVGSQNILVAEPDDTGASTVQQLQERVHGLSAEQILLSSYFNLQTTRAPGMEDELQELAKQAETGDTKAAIEYLRKLSEGSRLDTGDSPITARKTRRG